MSDVTCDCARSLRTFTTCAVTARRLRILRTPASRGLFHKIQIRVVACFSRFARAYTHTRSHTGEAGKASPTCEFAACASGCPRDDLARGKATTPRLLSTPNITDFSRSRARSFSCSWIFALSCFVLRATCRPEWTNVKWSGVDPRAIMQASGCGWAEHLAKPILMHSLWKEAVWALRQGLRCRSSSPLRSRALSSLNRIPIFPGWTCRVLPPYVPIITAAALVVPMSHMIHAESGSWRYQVPTLVFIFWAFPLGVKQVRRMTIITWGMKRRVRIPVRVAASVCIPTCTFPPSQHPASVQRTEANGASRHRVGRDCTANWPLPPELQNPFRTPEPQTLLRPGRTEQGAPGPHGVRHSISSIRSHTCAVHAPGQTRMARQRTEICTAGSQGRSHTRCPEQWPLLCSPVLVRSRQLQQALDPTVRGPQGARTDRLFRVDFLIGGNVKHLKLVQLVLIVALVCQTLQARDLRSVSARSSPAASRQRRHKHRNPVRVHVVRNVRVCLAQEPAKVKLPAGHFLPLVSLPSVLYFLPLTFKARRQCACSCGDVTSKLCKLKSQKTKKKCENG